MLLGISCVTSGRYGSDQGGLIGVLADTNLPPEQSPVDVALQVADDTNEATKYFNPWYVYTSMGIGLLSSLRQAQKRGKRLVTTEKKYTAAKVGQEVLETRIKTGAVSALEDVPDVLYEAIGTARKAQGV